QSKEPLRCACPHSNRWVWTKIKSAPTRRCQRTNSSFSKHAEDRAICANCVSLWQGARRGDGQDCNHKDCRPIGRANVVGQLKNIGRCTAERSGVVLVS